MKAEIIQVGVTSLGKPEYAINIITSNKSEVDALYEVYEWNEGFDDAFDVMLRINGRNWREKHCNNASGAACCVA